jgi:hypothetical protein
MSEFNFLKEHDYFDGYEENQLIGQMYFYRKIENNKVIEGGSILIPFFKENMFSQPVFSYIIDQVSVGEEKYPKWFRTFTEEVMKKYEHKTRIRKLINPR